MMASLFLIFLVCIGLIVRLRKIHAFVVALINLVFMIFMLLHHATDILNIRL